ncbi:MAG: GGDEF domain-containing protein [Pseudomonadota bacterium]
MDAQILLQWATPLILVGFTSMFILAWHLDGTCKSALLVAASYATGAMSFVVELFFKSEGDAWTGLMLEDLGYMAGASLLTAGLFVRAGRKPPIALLVGACLAGYAADWYLVLQGQHVLRTQIITAFCAILFILPIVLLPEQWRGLPNRVLIALLTILSISLALNAAMFTGSPDGENFNYEASLFAAAASVIINVASTFIAVVLLAGYVSTVANKLRQETLRDPLTNLLNRRGFEEPCERLVEANAEAGRPGALLIFDLDHFKKVNDGFGHTVGDEVITALARALESNVPDGALVARLGGEEMCVAMDFCTPDMARIVAQGVRSAFATNVATLDHSKADNLNCTVSVGIASFTKSYRRTFMAADEALYRAKASGRDRIAYAKPADDTRLKVA